MVRLLTGTWQLWDLGTGKHLRSCEGHSSSILALQLDHRKLISGSRDETVKVSPAACFLAIELTPAAWQVWDLATGTCDATLTDGVGIVWCLAFDDRRLFTGSNQQAGKMWDFGGDCADKAIRYIQ